MYDFTKHVWGKDNYFSPTPHKSSSFIVIYGDFHVFLFINWFSLKKII
jgi:hypothetical protein